MSANCTTTRERRSRTLSLIEDDGLDPEIKIGLERLNTTSEEINRLEKQLEDARQTYRQTLTELSSQVTEKAKQNKRSIRKAEAYHAASKVANEAHQQAQEAALKYHRAVDIFNAAKETISCAESAAFDEGGQRREFDEALQELLNHATMKLNEAEEEKTKSKIEHDQKAQVYVEAKQRVEFLARKFKSSIAKSRSFYEAKANFHVRVKENKECVEEILKKMSNARSEYSEALKFLENISDSIHEKREFKKLLDEQRRGSGVGAEATAEFDNLEISPDLPDIFGDDESNSEAGSMDSDRMLTDLQKRPLHSHPNPSMSRRVSGCSESETSSARSSMREKIDVETRLPHLRERGDGLSPVSKEDEEDCPFTVGEAHLREEESGDSISEKNIDKKGDVEQSEESGFADASESEVSEIDMDDLSDDLETESPLPLKQEPVVRKTLKKLIPDEGEIWL